MGFQRWPLAGLRNVSLPGRGDPPVAVEGAPVGADKWMSEGAVGRHGRRGWGAIGGHLGLHAPNGRPRGEVGAAARGDPAREAAAREAGERLTQKNIRKERLALRDSW